MSDVEAVRRLVEKHQDLKKEIGKIIVGQDDVVDQVLWSIYTGGHSLLIGVPGLAKTLMVNTIARALGLDFKRIQFTPDLMPSDILGSEVATLVNEEKQTGTYEITWFAESLPSGVYFYKLQAGDFVETKKMILLK